MKIRKSIPVVTTFVVALLLSGAIAAPAGASTPQNTTIAVPMYVAGYDVAVAEAHGYQIVTAADGTESSVPVTAKAKLQVSSEGNGPIARPDGTGVSVGDCGESTITLSRVGANVRYKSTYYVNAVAYEQVWGLALTWNNGFVDDVTMSGLNDSQSWSSSGSTTHYPTSAGFGEVAPGSYALLVDGAICFSGSPATTWS